MTTRYFRAGVGTVIYTPAGDIAFFRRAKHPQGVWQFQQGGIDRGELPENTLWRELKEEVGLEKEDVARVTPLPDWTLYEDLEASTDGTIERIGQAHRWFFVQLTSEAVIDLAKATDNEFDAWEFVIFKDAIARTSDHKRHVYEQLYKYFTEHLMN